MSVKLKPTARKSAERVPRRPKEKLRVIDTDLPQYGKETAEEIEERMKRVDRHIITREEYEEIPELTREWFETADFKIGGKLIRRGRPPKEKKKVAISIRLSEHVVEAFKYCGPGWQTRIDEALEQWLEEHPAQTPAASLTAKAPSGRAGSKPASPRPRPKR